MQMKQNGAYGLHLYVSSGTTTGQRCCVRGSVCGVFGSYGSIRNRKQSSYYLVAFLYKTARKMTNDCINNERAKER